jgi:hypothetical protein
MIGSGPEAGPDRIIERGTSVGLTFKLRISAAAASAAAPA